MAENTLPTWRDNIAAFKYLPPFLRLIWRTSPRLTSLNAALRLCQTVIPVLSLYIAKLIIDEILYLRTQGGTWAGSPVGSYIAAEFGLLILADVLSRGVSLTDALLGDMFANRSSLELMAHAATLDLAQFEDAAFYDKMERARRQTIGRVQLMSQFFSQMQDTLTLLALGAGLVVFNPWLILLLLLAVIPSFLSENYFNRVSYSLARSWTPERRELDYLRYVAAADDTAKEIKLFGLSPFLQARFKVLADKYFEMNKGIAIRRSIWGLGLNIVGSAGYYAAYIYIVMQAIAAQISLGDLTFLTGAFSRMQGLLQGILGRFTAIAQNALYLQDWFEFFEMRPRITAPASPRPLPSVWREGIRFENVGFRYPNSERWAVRHLSFTLYPSEKLALVGENGAGKTTIVKLLTRLYAPDEGRILLDGYDLHEYDPQAWREQVGVIFQDYLRYKLTASENIAVGKIAALHDTPRITQSAHMSLADTVISKLPAGYDQRLGKHFDSGVELSGGEWQKIALARAYMREAQLVILDEPTAALDARAEAEVFQRFSELTAGKAAVLISHRFSTVRMADRIVVLRQGELAEIGTHEELLALGGLYAELFGLQAEGYK